MEAIYDFVNANISQAAADWFNERSEAIYTLERSPERGLIIPEDN